MKFEELGLAESLVRSVRAEGYHTATPIQAAAIPAVLAGKDLFGCAQTGTGKTAAFALPTLHRLSGAERRASGRTRPIRSLVLAPTRELALQICESFRVYGRHTGLRQTTVYGGVSQHAQVRALKAGVDILIATPGRLLDLMNQGYVDLQQVEILVLDEADRMLDMGFIHDLRRIVAKTPRKRQTLLFSATMPAEIRSLASQWLVEPVDVCITPPASTVALVQQSVYFIEKRQKMTLLAYWLGETPWTRVLVFTRTKHGADKVVRHLTKTGIPADALHGNKSQSARQRALARFQQPKPLVLVATDIAARGLDVDQISHVINFDMPMDPESYVHRIGRTGRAEASGIAISFCDREERALLRSIQTLTRRTLAIEETPAGMPRVPDGPAKTSGPSQANGASRANSPAERRSLERNRRPSKRGGIPGKNSAANRSPVKPGAAGPKAANAAIPPGGRRRRRREAAKLAARS
jgi:ATP-dependent RNA helicase RhlE